MFSSAEVVITIFELFDYQMSNRLPGCSSCPISRVSADRESDIRPQPGYYRIPPLSYRFQI